MSVRLSILVPTCGRDTLIPALYSATSQMRDGDEILIDRNDDGDWGHLARNRMIDKASGDAILFLDDDDWFVDGALSMVRDRFEQAPRTLHLYRMRYTDGRMIWTKPILEIGQVSTGTIVAPNLIGYLGMFGDRYQGDYDFAASTAELLPDPPIWHEDVLTCYGRT